MDMTPLNSQKLASKVNPNVLQCNPGYHWDWFWKKCIVDCPTGYHNDSITGSCVKDGGTPPVIISYAGVNISYYTASHLLGFNNDSDVNKVLDQLDADYENYNTAYENQYPNFTAFQLDSLDSVRSFDQLQSYKNFEAKFSGYTSQRRIFENNETTWLNNNMIGPDPDSLDYTVDNSDNAICNNNYQFIIAGTTYQWTSTGLISVGGESLVLSPLSVSCFSNHRVKKPPLYSSDQTRMCKLKVAINECLVRGEAKAKVKSFKKKPNGGWKHSRIDLKVDVAGSLNDGRTCGPWLVISKVNGYKKRSELKVLDRESWWGAYTTSGQLQGTLYTTVSGLSGTLFLQ